MGHKMTKRTIEQQIYDAQMPKGEVGSIREVIDTPSGENRFVVLVKGVSSKVRNIIKNAIGVDVSGYSHTMDSSSIKHAIKKHSGDPVPLQVKDFDLAPDIITNPDSIRYIGKNSRGLDVIEYTKQYDGKVAYLEEIRNGRHQLVMNTMYWISKSK